MSGESATRRALLFRFGLNGSRRRLAGGWRPQDLECDPRLGTQHHPVRKSPRPSYPSNICAVCGLGQDM